MRRTPRDRFVVALTLLVASLLADGCSNAGLGPPAGGDGGLDGGSDLATQTGCTGLSSQPRSSMWTLHQGSLVRAVNVHVPASYDPTQPMALVLNFHGFTSNADQEDALSTMSAKADAAGFVALHPNGTGNPQSWNAGACCGDAKTNQVDDIGFVNQLLDFAESQLCIDKRRIFATGLSNGGFLSHRIGCEMSSRIAAIAPVAAVMGMPTCAPARPMPVMGFHGTGDTIVPYGGSPALGFPSVTTTYDGWAMRDGCTLNTTETFRKMDAHCATYAGCPAGVEVTLCSVDNGGHTWPGGQVPPALGYTTPYLSATDAMWTFFQKHPLP